MSSAGDRTEQATPTRLRKAREDGQVALSKDLTAAVILIAAYVALRSLGPGWWEDLRLLAAGSLAAIAGPLDTPTLLEVLGRSAGAGALMLAPLLLVVTVVSLAAPFVQVGPLLTFKPLTPKLERLNPAPGLQRMFVKIDTYVELGKGLLKLAAAGAIAWAVASSWLADTLALPAARPEAVGAVAWQAVLDLLAGGAVFLAAAGGADFFYQKWKHARDLRMTKDEVRREHKEEEGDPQHKAERRRLHEDIATAQMLEAVRDADVIITNPTHLACALRYDPRSESAPRLVGKGQDHIARRILEVAKREDIPVVRDRGLARSLHALRVDTQIPEDLYEAVAEVLRWVEAAARAEGYTPTWLQAQRPPGEDETPS